MKVFLVICLQILVTVCITVPPTWPSNGRITYKNPSVASTALPVNTQPLNYQSFYPTNITPVKKVTQLQYRPPNNQHSFVYHPQPSEQTKIKNNTPQSYQIVHFDNENVQDIPVRQKQYLKHPIRQHLTEISQNKNLQNKQDIIKEENDEISEHEIPREVPTKPIYPGEGQWAKYGLKHKPYNHPHSSNPKKEQTQEAQERDHPEGYDTFEEGQEQFRQAQNDFTHKSKTLPTTIEDSETESSPLYQKPEIGFIPEKLYTQVRRTETEEHLPRSAIDPNQEENAGRLKEVIKDSKIHTVYTEEGYEDSAYDHAGHEKNAENHEGHAQVADDQSGSSGKAKGAGRSRYSGDGGRRHGKNNVRRRLENSEKFKNDDYNNSESYSKKANHDAETAGSHHESKKLNPTVPSKNVKKVTMKNGKNEEIDMEVYTEVKYTPQKEKHKYVKIIPSTQKTPESTEKSLKRVKRYDKDKLSKRYVRKRPTYYWKKNRTTSTERPLINTRRNFEAAFKTYGKSQNILVKDYYELPQDENYPKPSTTVKTTTTGSTTIQSSTSSSSTTTTSTTTIKPKEDIHPDLLNPELTTRVSKPSTPKVLPVKIRKFKVKRQKRFTNDFPTIQVDLKEFTDIEKLPDPTKVPDLTHVKYPYYNLPVSEKLHENSPLRYAEDMKNIPKKEENELSFYESREDLICPEIESDVNPIPERIQKQKEGEETDKMTDIPDLPRLKGLGDKIDCLKVKYFGENPLDSPFFQEEIIEDPIPFFTIKDDKTTQKRELKIQILEPIIVLEEELIESATINPIHQNAEAVLKPPYTLTEMMTMNQEKIIKIKPKSIYDQISLLEKDDKMSEEKNNVPPTEKFIIIYNNQEVAKMAKNNITETPEMKQDVKNYPTVKPQETVRKPQIRKRPVNIIRKLPVKTIKKPQHKTITKPSTTTTPIPTTTTAITTNNPPTNKMFQLSPATIKPAPNQVQPSVKPYNNWQTANRRIAAFYNIFDISRFLPRVPNHRPVTSEAQYKDFIKPSEQIKVYSDVLQNINNEKENKETSDSKTVAVKVSVPKEEMQEKDIEQHAQEVIIGMLPPSNSSHYKTITTQESTPAIVQPEASQRINYFYFIGMRPPNQDKYSRSKRDTSKSKKKSNKDVEDLMMEESRFSYQRSKRHLVESYNKNDDLMMDETENIPVYSSPPQRKRKVYTEIVRQRPSRPSTEEPEEEEEDLNPRKRIYELKSTRSSTTPSEIEEEIIEEIVTEPPEPTTTSEPIIYPVEANSDNPNVAQYIFFIDKLHNKWAKEDATSTTKPTTTTTTSTVMTQVVAETVNVRRGEPAYLQIINQLHNVRKEEEDKTPSATTEATTTEVVQPVSVKNSNPFILDPDVFMSELKSMKAKLDPDNTAQESNQDSSRNRNFSARFKTNIDTSKYKTIERAPVNVRHNLSSRFNAEDQELPLQKEKTTQMPMIIAIITRPHAVTAVPKESTTIPDSVLEETTNQEPESEPSTTTVRPRQRGRTRGRPSTTARPTIVTSNPIFRRRRPSRITTTTQPTTTKSELNFRRRTRPKAVETKSLTSENPVAETTETVVVVTPVNSAVKEEEPKKQRRFQKVQERHVMSEVTLTRFFEPESDETDDNSEETRKHQYEVIGPLTNVDTGHGGNYKHDNEEATTYFTDPNLAENVNTLKDTTTEKTQASNSLLTQEELADKDAQKPVNLYPNMARMVNRLAEMKSDEVSGVHKEEEEITEKPTFILDPSRRMYYYAKP